MKPTTAEIYARCEDLGECLRWTGTTCNHVPQMYRSNGRGSGTKKAGTYWSCRRIVFEERAGPIPPGMFPVPMCRDKMCVRFEHLRLLTSKQIGQLAAKEGKFSSPMRCAAISAGVRRSGQAKLTIEIAREIRASSESGKDIARRLGVDKSLPPRIRRGEAWRETVPNASVFSMVP